MNAENSLLMVFNPKLQGAAIEYATYRQSTDGGQHNVILANVIELYMQFGGGIEKHISGIRRFGHFMHDQATVKPKALFLMGKGIREANVGGLTSTGPGSRTNAINYSNNLIPSFGQPSSDVFITSRLPGTTNWKPLIPTGRIAAINNQELKDYLEKVKLYETQQKQDAVYSSATKDWQKHVIHFVGGDIPSQITAFQAYMNNMKNTIENRFFGGKVTTLAKSNSDPLNPNDLQAVMDRIETEFL
jgi:hypothetical protein